MTSFKKKVIGQGSTLAEILLSNRQTKGLSLKTCADQLNIQLKYLGYLESSDFDKLPGEAYVKHWLRQYCQLLELSTEECLARYYKEKNISHQLTIETEQRPENKQFNRRSLFNPTILKYALLSLATLFLLGYIGTFIYQTFRPPEIIFNQPFIDHKTQNNSLLISGQADPGTQMWFNDQSIIVNENGNFEQSIPLVEGLNILTIRAKKKHSRSFEKTVQVVKNALPDLIK